MNIAILQTARRWFSRMVQSAVAGVVVYATWVVVSSHAAQIRPPITVADATYFDTANRIAAVVVWPVGALYGIYGFSFFCKAPYGRAVRQWIRRGIAYNRRWLIRGLLLVHRLIERSMKRA